MKKGRKTMEIEFTSELVDKYARDLLFELTDEDHKREYGSYFSNGGIK